MLRDWKSTLAVMLVFALGGVAGLLVGFIVMHHRTAVLLQRGSPAYEQMLERRLSRGLDLDAGQEERKKLQEQLQPQVQALNIQTRRELHALLTPEQLATFRQNLEDFRRRFGAPGLGGREVEQAAGETNNGALPIGSTNTAPPPN
jgi:hypothetical protein